MVRIYVLKTTKGSGYSQETVQLAVNEVRRGILTTRKASRMYNIPYSTLNCYISGRRKVKSKSGGRPTALSITEEEKLANYLKIMEKWDFGLSRVEVLDCIEKFVVENKLKSPFKNNRPGEDWSLNFKRRHQLSKKKPQSVENSRKKMTDPFVIDNYFTLLHSTLKKLKLLNETA